ncbi:polysaccharide deacetylase family protein [Plectonema cf. radiosum LEGE 06105]|uniref:Polysaccharide deacetylase family protein n=1 Tax=Plectonema cf. radiosum LEGE 06105 TaxID=945769 RepID=A0A8J7FBH0_9CYAN|nr:polysaccharide deacetylase family protein [Plectonema radiosum]MBE9211181.1 polysaccharide deacetylase family protein [Plectonema cf. radiosum LEGE 06105]
MSEPIYSGDPNKPYIALTFDDGPYEITRKLLDVLRKHDVKATFFCIAPRILELPEIVQQTYKEGHLIANHSNDNQSLRTLDDNTILNKLRDTNEVIKQVTGYTPKYFRPPMGEPPFGDNRGDDRNRVTKLAETLGLTHIHWSDGGDTKDWESPGVGSIVESLLSAKNGSIILCHDLPGEGNKPRGEDTVKAVDIAIPQLKQRGLSFVTIEQLLSSTTQPPQRKCPPNSQIYEVQSGDDLSKIAEKFYGDGSEQSWRKIYEANKDLISVPEQIEPGWKLCIPQ